jgi:hypothetical protein
MAPKAPKAAKAASAARRPPHSALPGPPVSCSAGEHDCYAAKDSRGILQVFGREPAHCTEPGCTPQAVALGSWGTVALLRADIS